MSSMMTVVFGLFVAVVYLVLYVIDKRIKDDDRAVNVSNVTLLVASLFFVVYSDWRCLIILLAMAFVTYWTARNTRYIKIGIVFDLVVLCIFKYFNFFIESFPFTFRLVMPLGLSFFVFSSIGYLVDVYRGKMEAMTLTKSMLYLSYFPKFTSGPIMKSTDYVSQIRYRRSINYKGFEEGIEIFVFGLFKKVVLADRLAVFVDQVFDTPRAFGSLTLAFAVISYSLQIYLDFSGYSDMAIGISRMLGIRLPRNFNLPYLSNNVTEFWKRWHISLSEWLMNYLYIPLGGNRKGTVRTYINLMLTMMLGGLWHGSGLNFLIWGALHGLALVVHKLWVSITHSDKKRHGIASRMVSTALSFVFVSFTWIFFRADTTAKAIDIIIGIVSFRDGLQQPYFWSFVSIVLIGVATAVAIYKSRGNERLKMNMCKVEGEYPLLDLSKFWNLVFFFVECGLTIALFYADANPFIYGAF